MCSTRTNKECFVVCKHIILFNYVVDFYFVTTRKKTEILVTPRLPVKLSLNNGMFERFPRIECANANMNTNDENNWIGAPRQIDIIKNRLESEYFLS